MERKYSLFDEEADCLMELLDLADVLLTLSLEWNQFSDPSTGEVMGRPAQVHCSSLAPWDPQVIQVQSWVCLFFQYCLKADNREARGSL